LKKRKIKDVGADDSVKKASKSKISPFISSNKKSGEPYQIFKCGNRILEVVYATNFRMKLSQPLLNKMTGLCWKCLQLRNEELVSIITILVKYYSLHEYCSMKSMYLIEIYYFIIVILL